MSSKKEVLMQNFCTHAFLFEIEIEECSYEAMEGEMLKICTIDLFVKVSVITA